MRSMGGSSKSLESTKRNSSDGSDSHKLNTNVRSHDFVPIVTNQPPAVFVPIVTNPTSRRTCADCHRVCQSEGAARDDPLGAGAAGVLPLEG